MIATMALVTLFLLLVAGIGVALLRRVEHDPGLVVREASLDEPERRPGL